MQRIVWGMAAAMLALSVSAAAAQDAERGWEAVVPPGMEASHEGNRYAPAVRIGDMLILSGVIGLTRDGDNGPEAQFRRALERCDQYR